MKVSVFLCIIFCFFINKSIAQFSLENQNGDRLFNSFIVESDSVSNNEIYLLKINSSDESLGFDVYFNESLQNTSKYKIYSFGVKAKPTDGIASLFEYGQFSPQIDFSGSISQVKIFDREDVKPENNFIDWGTFYINFITSEYKFYKKDTIFERQVYSKKVNRVKFGINYNMLFKSEHLVSLNIGYTRTNNIDDLKVVEIRDVQTQFDSISNSTREVIKKSSAREGTYIEYDSYPINLAYTKLTNDSKKTDFGYATYLEISPSNVQKTITNIGFILFVAQQKENVSYPVLGLNFQFNDIFDVKNLNNGLMKRLKVGFTTTFNLF